jgi:hypothetical protein
MAGVAEAGLEVGLGTAGSALSSTTVPTTARFLSAGPPRNRSSLGVLYLAELLGALLR